MNTVLLDSYVIFLCDFDPFGAGKYRYTFRTICEETEKTSLKDGRCIVFLNTCGRNAEDIPQELLSFLKFVHADLKESQKEFQDDYVRQVQKSVTHIKASRKIKKHFNAISGKISKTEEFYFKFLLLNRSRRTEKERLL